VSKVTLTKAAPTVSLAKEASLGQLHVNLNWNARQASPQGGGFLKRVAAATAPGIDLDLGALFELSDGRKGVVQALGGGFGWFDDAPYVMLDGDDRSGLASGGENSYINLAYAQNIRRILAFARIYDGAPSFDQAAGVVTLKSSSGPTIEVRLDEHAGGSRMCAIALLENRGGQLVVLREVRYVNGAQDALDRTYGWGLDWTPGRK
jgi:tellurite resistance protein TerA